MLKRLGNRDSCSKRDGRSESRIKADETSTLRKFERTAREYL